MIPIRIETGDATRVTGADALVIPANKQLALDWGSHVAEAVRTLAGPAVEKELLAAHPDGIALGEAVASGPGEMSNVRALIHAAVLDKYDFNPLFLLRLKERTSRDTLDRATRAALLAAATRGLHTIAFTPMGAGIGGMRDSVCAEVMLRAIRETDLPLDVRIVCRKGKTADIFENAIRAEGLPVASLTGKFRTTTRATTEFALRLSVQPLLLDAPAREEDWGQDPEEDETSRFAENLGRIRAALGGSPIRRDRASRFEALREQVTRRMQFESARLEAFHEAAAIATREEVPSLITAAIDVTIAPLLTARALELALFTRWVPPMELMERVAKSREATVVRSIPLLAAAWWPDPRAQETVRALLMSSDALTARRAIRALARKGAVEDVALLHARLAKPLTEGGVVRGEALDAIRQIQSRIPGAGAGQITLAQDVADGAVSIAEQGSVSLAGEKKRT